MSTRQHEQFSVTWNQVAAFRLARHHLSERAPTKALLSVVRDMAGAQAQLLSAAQHLALVESSRSPDRTCRRGPQRTDPGQGFVHAPHAVSSAFRASGDLRSGFRTARGKRDPMGAREGRARPRRGCGDRCGARRVGPATHAAGDRRTREPRFGCADAGHPWRGLGTPNRTSLPSRSAN